VCDDITMDIGRRLDWDMNNDLFLDLNKMHNWEEL
jgi:hypothetical protein